MTVLRVLLLAPAAAIGCGASASRRAEAPANVAAARPPPAPYDGVTRCGPSAPPEPAPPVGAAGAGFVHGYLDKDLIAKPIRARIGPIRACYEAALAGDPAAAGTVSSRFVILADGSIADLEVRGFERELDACVCRELLAVAFPRFGSAKIGRVVVSYPFVFQP